MTFAPFPPRGFSSLKGFLEKNEVVVEVEIVSSNFDNKF